MNEKQGNEADNGKQEPPKIRLNMNGNGNNDSQQKEQANGAVPPKMRVKRPPTRSGNSAAGAENEADRKSETSRVELSAAQTSEPSQDQAGEQQPAEDSRPAGKSETSRIDIGEVLEQQETDEGEAVKLPQQPEAPAADAPKTIRIKRPETASVSRDEQSAGDAGQQPENGKSETSRIELPQEATAKQPATRRKTVKIKRPESAGGRSLTIARAPESAARTAPTVEAQGAEEEEIGPVITLVAVAAVVVGLVLLYILAAQTVMPGLPFPGRLV